ncbi:S8 family serine peptidase [Candidatus Woesearchaeota archaeon]|nr:S8 family serine peptidase [Candidatus Woesearchaeota archaeon]MBW3006497.1 S8 family serine peptidase [Candidatus Woesearchaeota archaeon]
MTEVQSLIGEEIYGMRLNRRILANHITLQQKNKLPNVISISAHKAHEMNQGNSARIAIINSGCCTAHPKIESCLETDALKQGRNILMCESLDPNDPADPDKKYLLDDKASHGTPIAGIITDVAPESLLYIFKVTKKGKQGTLRLEHVLRALAFSIHEEFDCDVINLSFGIDNHSLFKTACDDLFYNKGKLLVAAAGNTRIGKIFPAAFDSVISVGSVDDYKAHSIFSNLDETVDICAPGEYIFSIDAPHFLERLLDRATMQKISRYRRAYALNSGTSFATPHVSGVLALGVSLLRARGYRIGEDIPAEEVKQVLCDTAYKPEMNAEKVKSALREEIEEETVKRACGKKTKKFSKLLTAEDLQQKLDRIMGLSEDELYSQALGSGVVNAKSFLTKLAESYQ